MEVAERHHGDLEHRRVDVADEALGRRLRPDFHAAGWRVDVLVWMRWAHEPPREGPELRETAPEDLRPLRLEWALDESWAPDEATGRRFLRVEEEAGDLLGVRWFAVAGDDGRPIAFLQLVVLGDGVEIGQLYVTPAHRGRGLGTSLLLAAIRQMAGARDVWIVADDEGRPKELYRRLGFEPVWTSVNFTRLPR